MSDNLQNCSVCGEILTDYGNKELKDGILCRNCVKLASEWLSDEDYKKRTVKDIKKHLRYREANLVNLDSFKVSRKTEGKYSLYIDDDNKLFVVSKRKDLKKDNADVISLDDIVEMSVYEKKYQDKDTVDVYFDIKLNNKELNEVLFRVNEFNGLSVDSDEYKQASELAINYLDELMKDQDFQEEV